MRQTLPKSIILRGYQSFTKVLSDGSPFFGSMLTGFLSTGTAERTIAIGFSVPKKRVPLAVDRNRIRRLMREAVRKNGGELFTALADRNIGARIVLMYKGEKQKPVKRLTLHDLEPSWLDIQRQMLETL